MDKPLTKKDLLKAIQRMEEVGIIQGYKSMSDMFRMFVAQIPEAEPIECQPEWEKRLSEIFFTTYEGFLKREYVALSSKAILKDDLIGFIRNLLKEFAKDYGYKGWDVIEKKYGIED